MVNNWEFQMVLKKKQTLEGQGNYCEKVEAIILKTTVDGVTETAGYAVIFAGGGIGNAEK